VLYREGNREISHSPESEEVSARSESSKSESVNQSVSEQQEFSQSSKCASSRMTSDQCNAVLSVGSEKLPVL
jgi:hypothetical protein